VPCLEALVAEDTYNAGEGAVVRQGQLIALVVAFLIGYAVLLMAGASGVLAEASQENKQKHTEATNNEQGRSGGAASEGGDRCDRTRTILRIGRTSYLTNDLPGCPNKGGLLSARLPDTGKWKVTDPNYGLMMGEKGNDEIRGGSELYGGDGNDVIYGFSGPDWIVGDNGDDVIHAGDGNDYFLSGDKGDDVIYGGDGNDFMNDEQGEDVIYGGDGNDHLDARDPKDGVRDKLYCGAGRDKYEADPNDNVDSSCEMKVPTKRPDTYERSVLQGMTGWSGDDVAPVQIFTSSASASPVPVPPSGGPAILLPAAALLLGSGILTYAILRRR
jgi:hypothetical protein